VSAFPEQLRGLLNPHTYPHPVSTVELIETHISWVLLTGEFAYKIKRPVHYPFVDLRSPAHREFLCHEELRLNRRFAPELYLGVCAISLQGGAARFDATGTVIEHAVVMRQFPRDATLDRLLQDGRIAAAELETFGHELARAHALLPVALVGRNGGAPASTRNQILKNLNECARAAVALGAGPSIAALQPMLTALCDSRQRCLQRRFTSGRVRECHGDLHAGNIVRCAGRLVPFDCLEFDPALRWIDVAEEVAFLGVDLEARGHPRHAHAFLSGYLSESGDYEACTLLPLFEAHGALVRAKVAAMGDAGPDAAQLFDRYLTCVRRAFAPSAPVLILMCGLSGSGKTWMARQLAQQLRAVHLRSDVERRRVLRGPAAAHAGIEQGRYARAATARVYRHLMRCARRVLGAGYPAIVDATFACRADRQHMRRLASRLGVPVCVIYCYAPPALLRARVAERSAHRQDASEADVRVLEWQETRFEPPQAEEQFAVLMTDTAEPGALSQLLGRIGEWRAAPTQYQG